MMHGLSYPMRAVSCETVQRWTFCWRLDFIFIHDAELALPVARVDGAEGIVGQQAVFDDECRDGAGAGGVEERVMSDAEPAGNEELHALIGKEICLELRVAHGFMLQLRLDLLETSSFLAKLQFLQQTL